MTPEEARRALLDALLVERFGRYVPPPGSEHARVMAAEGIPERPERPRLRIVREAS